MEILLLEKPVSDEILRALAERWHGFVIKGVVDIEREVIVLGGEWHMDANVKLIEDGSSQQQVWGFNIYPDKTGDAAIEFISLINIRPAQGNRGQEIEIAEVRDAVRAVVARFVPTLKL